MLPKPSIRSAWAKAAAARGGVARLGWRSSVSRVDRHARVGEPAAAGEVGGDRREEVAAVEGRRGGLEPEGARTPMSTASAAPPSASIAGGSRPLSGPTKKWPSPARGRRRRGAGRRRRDRRSRGGRRTRGERDRVGEHRGARAHVVAADPVGDVDDLGAGRDPGDHGAADPGEVVGRPVVGEEGDRQRSAFDPLAATGAVVAIGALRPPGPHSTLSGRPQRDGEITVPASAHEIGVAPADEHVLATSARDQVVTTVAVQLSAPTASTNQVVAWSTRMLSRKVDP